jgi:hypothetical protein
MMSRLGFTLIGALSLSAAANAQDRGGEIALARSAGPAAVSTKATVYVLGSQGYEKAVEGTNGFVCLVDHERRDTSEPVCYDAEGAATLVPVSLDRAVLRTQGKSEPEIERRLAEGYRAGKYRAPARPGIAYMLGKEQTVFDPSRGKVIPYVPHLMFYAPYLTAADLGLAGQGETGEPFLINEGRPDAMVIVRQHPGD